MRSAVRPCVRDHRFRELAAIERVACRCCDALEGCRHRGTREHLAGLRCASPGQEVLGPAEVLGHDRDGRIPFLRDDRRHAIAFPGVTNRRCEQLLEREATVALRQGCPARYSAGDRDRFPAAFRNRLLARVAFRHHGHRRAARCIQSREGLAVPHDREEIAAEAVAARLDHRQRDGARERSIDRVAALLQHGDARTDRERLRRRDDVTRE